jgi:uncharacterized protein YggU (UPF0235/DUF167 family)
MPCVFDVTIVGKKGHIHWELNSETIHCYVTHEPLSEDANKEIIDQIARAVSLPHSKITLVHGPHDYTKRIHISDAQVSLEDVLDGLGLKKSGE